MTHIDHILVIVDPTAKVHPAIDKAVHIAQACGARVELYACDTGESRALRRDAASAAGASVPSLDELLQALAQPIHQRGVAVQIQTEAGDPLHSMLLERTRAASADLVVKDTHHHSLAKRTFITNTDWELIRGCAAPLLLVKATQWHAAPVIAAAVDPGHAEDRTVALDQLILQCSQWLAQRLAGTLQALHAFLPLEPGMPATTAGAAVDAGSAFSAQITPAARAARQTQLEQFVQPYGIDATQLHLQLGVASEVLPSLAQQLSVDLLVMGAISRSGLARFFIGSTAERVLEYLPCDVLILKPAGSSILPRSA